jgi:hypothetical protein
MRPALYCATNLTPEFRVSFLRSSALNDQCGNGDDEAIDPSAGDTESAATENGRIGQADRLNEESAKH